MYTDTYEYIETIRTAADQYITNINEQINDELGMRVNHLFTGNARPQLRYLLQILIVNVLRAKGNKDDIRVMLEEDIPGANEEDWRGVIDVLAAMKEFMKEQARSRQRRRAG
jgi:hypothetical protein